MAIISKKRTDGGTSLSDILSAAVGGSGMSMGFEAFNDFGSAGFKIDAAADDIADMQEKIAAGLAQHKDSLESIGLVSAATPNEAQLSAMAMMALICQNTTAMRAYHKTALETTVVSEEGIQVIQPSANPAFGYGHTPSQAISNEAFDARQLEAMRNFNTMFAFSAALQDEFAEAFFKTVTVSPDSTGLELSISRTVVQQEIRHPLTGEVVDFKQRNLLDAITEPAILINESTRIYQCVRVGDAASEKHFTEASIIAPRTIAADIGGGLPLTVAPLRPGANINLIGIGQNERTPGQMDQTDAIDHLIKLEKVYLRLKKGNVTNVIEVNTKHYAKNVMLKSNEGRDRRVILDMPTKSIALSADTVDYNTGAPATLLQYLNAGANEGVTINLTTTFSGEANLQIGNVRVTAAPFDIASAGSASDEDNYNPIKDRAALEALFAEFDSVDFVGYDLIAYYPNTNKRFLGSLVDTVTERVRYVIPLSPPISVQTPITATTTATDMAAPMNAQRILNSINAVTKLIEVRDTLREVTPLIKYRANTEEAPEIEGFARTMIRPILHEDTVDISNVISSVSSSTRVTDIQSVLVNAIRYSIANVYTESRYQPALDAMNGTAGARPQVVIGTDPTTASYLMVNGDPRLVGCGFEAKVVVSYDIRVRGEIFIAFVRPQVADVDLLSFGTFAYIPELAVSAQLPYNGANTNVTQIQNRNLHIAVCPILINLHVTGLEQAASQRVNYPVGVN